MIKNNWFFLILFYSCLFFYPAQAQKVKYKDLLNLLNGKQYEEAEPFLKRYLKENDDNASAYLFMGIIYHEKSVKTDILKETDKLFLYIDSAVIFYDKAYPKITEKEIKKNDENYQMYTRRNLRTGEFGINYSDVLLDIETRTKGLKERKEKVKQLKQNLADAEKQYGRAQQIYKDLHSRFNTKKELYLQADDELISLLEKLTLTFDSSQVSFKNYKVTLQAIGKTNYNQVVNLIELKDFKKEGLTGSNFLDNDLGLWDYTQWSKKTVRIIRDEVYPYRKELTAFDIEINKLREKIKKDSVMVNTAELLQNPVFEQMKKWDEHPLPDLVFRMKIYELDYLSSTVEEASLKVSDISKRIVIIKKQINQLHGLDSVSSALIKDNSDERIANYKAYISSSFGTGSVLKNLIKATNELAKRETIRKQKELDNNLQLLKWVISESDSIPLFKDVPESSVYRPLVIGENHTSGVKLDSLLTGYFYTVTPSRTADLKVSFPLDTANIKERNLPLIQGLSLAVTDQAYFILFYSEGRVDGKIPVTLAKITRLSGLEWSQVFSFDLVPVELKFSNTNGELSIRTTSREGDNKMVVIDKTGKRLQ